MGIHFLFATIGTDGDVFPYAALGRELRRRGHHITLAAAEPYRALAAAQGFDFVALVSREENDELFLNPDFWNPLKAAPLAARWGVRFLPSQYELLSRVADAPEETVIVANPGVFAAPMVSEKRKLPLVSLVLQPGIIPSSLAPPVMPGLAFLRGAPRQAWDLFWRGLDLMGGHLVGRELNALRAALGLPPLRRLFRDWLSPDLVLGMFPDWYGPPAADWPEQIRLTGFPLAGDAGSSPQLDTELRDFCQAGPPPVVFTFGTGMAQPARQFRAAREACESTGRRGVFLTKHPDQLPGPLPPSIRHRRAAPFAALFPLCSAIVHHGGIGTTSAAMAAGLPQVICPICFDQEDNALRVRQLGIGHWLPKSLVRGPALAQALAAVANPGIKTRCEAIRARLEESDGLRNAADALESFVRQKRGAGGDGGSAE